jgi:hypothetical protein
MVAFLLHVAMIKMPARRWWLAIKVFIRLQNGYTSKTA